MRNEHTSLGKYTSHTLFSKGLWKGWCWYVWEVSWRRNRLPHIDPQVPLYYSRTSSSFCWAAQPGVTESPSPLSGATASGPQLRLELEQWLQLELNSAWLEHQLTQTVCGTWLYNCLTSTSILWASHLHRIQPVHRSRWYSDIFDRMHLFLDWRLGRRSICYSKTLFKQCPG